VKQPKKYKIPYTTLHGWRQKYLDNKEIPYGRKRTKGAGAKPYLTQEQEQEIITWIIECRQYDVPLTKEMIKEYTIDSFPNPDFVVSDGWLKNFMKRYNLVTRVTTFQNDSIITIEERNEYIIEYWSTIKKLRQIYNIQQDRIINMDEVPVTFDMTPSRIIDFIGTNHPVVLTTGATKRRCTVVLSCFVDGTLLPLMVIFKGIMKIIHLLQLLYDNEEQ